MYDSKILVLEILDTGISLLLSTHLDQHKTDMKSDDDGLNEKEILVTCRFFGLTSLHSNVWEI